CVVLTAARASLVFDAYTKYEESVVSAKMELAAEQEGAAEVPDHLKDSHRDAEALGHGKGYIYPHEHEGHFVPQQYLPPHLLGSYFYRPSDEGYEAQVRERLERWRAAQRKALGIETTQEFSDLPVSRIEELKRHLK
ncbi:MAG: hypothetical protein ACK8QZ_12630, partial [Anaerolineales bacterium]